MKFNEIRDANGVSLQSYVDVLQEKSAEHDLFCTIVFAGKEGTKNTGVHAVTPIDGPPQRGLLLLALTMYGLNRRQQNEFLQALAMLEKSDEEPETTPVLRGEAT